MCHLIADGNSICGFCKQFAEIEAGKREPVIYTGNLDNIRDFTDVDDPKYIINLQI